MANLKIGTYNVKGLRDNKKRRKIFNYLHQKQFDIICLQETHSVQADEGYWKNEFGGSTFFSHGTSDSRGTMILIRKNAPVKVENSYKDNLGRRVFCELKYEGQSIILANIYAPNKDDPVFFLETFLKLASFENGKEYKKIIVGDFNLVLDVEVDKQGGNPTTHTKSVNALKSYMTDEGLVDIWRYKHPDSKEVTWKVMKPQPIFERLDLILISSELIDHIGAEGIKPAYLSDHSIPWVVIIPTKAEKGRGFWRFNTRLLADKEYIEFMNTELTEILSENRDSVNKWEWLKHKVREKTIMYSSRKNRDRCNKLLLYEKKLKDYNEMLRQKIRKDEKDAHSTSSNNSSLHSEELVLMSRKEILDKINWLERERDEIIEYKTRGAMVRARRDWLQYGEKNSKYFFNLEAKNYKRKK